MFGFSRLKNRPLLVESLESRRLFACDLAMNNVLEPQVAAQSIEVANFKTNVSSSDAGSTRETAADIGAIDGTRRLSGTLGLFDRVDMVQFNVARNAQATLRLSGLNQDADIYLVNASGHILGQSTRHGRSDETIEVALGAGDYYLRVFARSFWHTRYNLTIQTELQPPSVPSVEATPTFPTSPIPARSVAPLPEVAYFGGSREWNLNAIGAPEAWAAGYTGAGVLVAVIDSGVDLDHPALVNRLYVNPSELSGNCLDNDRNGSIGDLQGYDFVDNDAVAEDGNGHGTHVAGTIAAVAPGAKILPIRVLDNSGSGNAFDVAAGIRYAADLGAQIINLSLGGGYSRAIDAAIEYAKSRNSLIVVAAGNESAAVPSFPARFSAGDSHVISVGAFSSAGQLASFSNDVGNSGAIQIDAPGVGIYSTTIGGRHATLSGTSMAAPHVAGLAALTISANPQLSSSEVRELMVTGTIGRAAGSDALGKLSATNTVAYAAAGLTRVGNAIAPASRSVAVAANGSDRMRATSISYVGVSDLAQATFERPEFAIAQHPEAFASTTARQTSLRDEFQYCSISLTEQATDFALVDWDNEPEDDTSPNLVESLSMFA